MKRMSQLLWKAYKPDKHRVKHPMQMRTLDPPKLGWLILLLASSFTTKDYVLKKQNNLSMEPR